MEVNIQKAINIENSNIQIVRVLSVAEPDTIECNATNQNYILVDNFTKPPELQTPYCMYDKENQKVIWKQIQYQNTATEELFEIEDLKSENNILKNQSRSANENIDFLTEALAYMIGGTI